MSNACGQYDEANASYLDTSGYPLYDTQIRGNYLYDIPQTLQSFPPPAYPSAYEQQQGGILDSLAYDFDPQTNPYDQMSLDPQQTQLPAFDLNEGWACNTQQSLGFFQDQPFPPGPPTVYDSPGSRDPQMPTPYEAYTAYDLQQMSHFAAQPPYSGYGLNVSEQPSARGGDLQANERCFSGYGENDTLLAGDLGALDDTTTCDPRDAEAGQVREEVAIPSRTPKTITTNQSLNRRVRRKRVFELLEQLDPKVFVDSSCHGTLNTATCEVDRYERGAVRPSYEGEPENSLGVPVLVPSQDLQGRASLELVREGMDAHMVARNRTPLRWRGPGSANGAPITPTVNKGKTYRSNARVCRSTARHLVSSIDSKIFLDDSCMALVNSGSADTRKRLECMVSEVRDEIDRFERGVFKRDDYTGEPENSRGVPVLVASSHRLGHNILEVVREPMAKVLQRKSWLMRELQQPTKDVV